MEEQEPTNMTIRTNRSAHDYRSFSTMNASLDRDRFPRKNGRKLSETLIAGNKITQYQDNISKEAKVGSSIEGKKFHQY